MVDSSHEIQIAINMSAPAKNQNAVKPAEERASANLNIRTLPRNRSAWVAAAVRCGKPLSSWVTRALNEEAGK